MTEPAWIRLLLFFTPLSLISVGGNPTILAELKHYTVDVTGWLTAAEFINVFALSQIAPGPGTLIATLIGWKASGWIGAVVATLAFGGPSSVLFYGAVVLFRRRQSSLWMLRLEQGLVPVAIGLIIAGSSSIVMVSEHSSVLLPTAAVSAALSLWRSLNPLLIILVAACVFALMFLLA